ncbi:hypothetical protein INT45_009495 [Circinella minor]|uniref:Uncharacterized protein n=1 Tax=Circinella minor TaxID=1195481 RepID=A0A8H7SBH3_9FUNG|nr:hypothetical protein INT45_009495 [Circinella minor]
MTPHEILTLLFKNKKYLNLTKSIGKRYQPYINTARAYYKLDQDTLITSEERRVLINISYAKSDDQLKTIIKDLYMQDDLSENINYIRAACQHLLDLWRSKRLNDHGNNEGWLRSNVYSMLWDRAFLFHDQFYIKRAECQSAVIKFLQLDDPDGDLVQQKIDFILRNSNDESDYLSTEEKPGDKSENDDVCKGRQVQRHMLDLWNKWLGSPLLTSQLEAITYQWHGSSLHVFGTKMLSDQKVVSYKKSNVTISNTSDHFADVAYFLLIVISIKRSVTLNYMKLTTMLAAINRHSIASLEIRSSNQAYHDDSAPSSQSSNDNDNIPIDLDLPYIKDAIEMCSTITHQKNVVY